MEIDLLHVGACFFILMSKSITGKDLNVKKKKTKKTEENMSKLFISSKSGKSLSENAIKHRMKNLIKVKLKKKYRTAILT